MSAMLEARTERRLQLRRNGFLPLPLHGKIPAMKNWSSFTVVSTDMLRLWDKLWDCENTGILTRHAPAIDLDLFNEEAVIAVEDMIRARYEEHGRVLVRIGKPPKRAIIFKTDQPFKKIVVNLIAPSGAAEKIEFLGDGQQLVVSGRHPDGMDYRWFNGEPWHVPRTDLPHIDEREAHALINDATEFCAANATTPAHPQRVRSPPAVAVRLRLTAKSAGTSCSTISYTAATCTTASAHSPACSPPTAWSSAAPNTCCAHSANSSSPTTRASKPGCARSDPRSIPPTKNLPNADQGGAYAARQKNRAQTLPFIDMSGWDGASHRRGNGSSSITSPCAR